jgi:hypothetical protein
VFDPRVVAHTPLDHSYCKIITDAGLEKVAAGCSKSTSINLDHCMIVTNVGLKIVAKGYSVLTSLAATTPNTSRLNCGHGTYLCRAQRLVYKIPGLRNY